jgi:hypothetical protein
VAGPVLDEVGGGGFSGRSGNQAGVDGVDSDERPEELYNVSGRKDRFIYRQPVDGTCHGPSITESEDKFQ